jgi:hypothetical protein
MRSGPPSKERREADADPAAKAAKTKLDAIRKEVQKEAMEMGLTLQYLRKLPDDYLDEPKEDLGGSNAGRRGGGGGSSSSLGLDDDEDDANALEPTWDKPAARRTTVRFRPPSQDPWDFKMCRRTLGRQSNTHITFGGAPVRLLNPVYP